MLKKLAVSAAIATVAMAGLLQSVPAHAQIAVTPQSSSGAPQQNHGWNANQQGGQQGDPNNPTADFWKKWQAMSKEQKAQFADEKHHERMVKEEEHWKAMPAEEKIRWIEQRLAHNQERREERRDERQIKREEWQADHPGQQGGHPVGNGQQGGQNRQWNTNNGSSSSSGTGGSTSSSSSSSSGQ